MSTASTVIERNRADLSRRSFSVLCWRGWCDHDFKIRDIAALITMTTGVMAPFPVHLQKRECPSPGTCQCVCHDGVKA